MKVIGLFSAEFHLCFLLTDPLVMIDEFPLQFLPQGDELLIYSDCACKDESIGPSEMKKRVPA